MNCSYCHNPLIPHPIVKNILSCHKCPTRTTFILQAFNQPEIAYTHFKKLPYLISLDYGFGATYLYKIKLIIKLNYLIDISPSNFDFWLEKLLNLKAFS